MPTPVRKSLLTGPLLALSASSCLLLSAGASLARATTTGILPPRNPGSNCNRGNAFGGGALSAINACRALEDVGPLRLPKNWSALTPVQQGFVLINLERVNRGLPAVVGLSPALNQLASDGAGSNTDPAFPGGGFVSGGAVWAQAPSVIVADYMWMYDDGPGSGNLDCTSASGSGCWGHRDIILWTRGHSTLVGGGGASRDAGFGSYAFTVLSGYKASGLTFTWSSELKHFAAAPSVEPAGAAASQGKRHKTSHKKPRHRKLTHQRPRRHRKAAPKRVRHHRPAPGGLTITFG